jgi:exopolysaccharide production protein ExoY
MSGLLREPLTARLPQAGSEANHHDARLIGHHRERLKRGLDIMIAAAMLLLLSPLIAVVSLCLWSGSGPVLFGHQRMGRGGRRFSCLKFCTMVPNAELLLNTLLETNAEAALEWRTTHKLLKDPRVTRVGRVLRKTSLDELPQLINVLRGEMSIVGPRPVPEAEMWEHYGPFAANYLSVRPGITGLWQVSGRSNTSYVERVALDVRYVREFSLLGDLRIIAKTIPVVLARRGAV